MKKFSVYELLSLLIGCTVCFFIIAESVIMLIRPTSTDNIDIRKQITAIVYFLAGSVNTILAAKLVNQKQNSSL